MSEGSRNDFGPIGNFVPFEGGSEVRSRGYLPHWEADHATYFVTIRLGDSLPDYVLRDLRSTYGDQALIHLEKYLDEGHGECILRDPRCADIVDKATLYFHEKRYTLYAHCVMPNHAHAIFQPFVGEGLSKILHSWKSFTAKEINKTLEKSGQVWQDEYFDHIIRSEKQLHNLILYVAANPRNAGLKELEIGSAENRGLVARASCRHVRICRSSFDGACAYSSGGAACYAFPEPARRPRYNASSRPCSSTNAKVIGTWQTK